MLERRTATATVIIGANCNVSDNVARLIFIGRECARFFSINAVVVVVVAIVIVVAANQWLWSSVIYRPSAEMVSTSGTDKDDNL